jgi:hypothetical protein
LRCIRAHKFGFPPMHHGCPHARAQCIKRGRWPEPEQWLEALQHICRSCSRCKRRTRPRRQREHESAGTRSWAGGQNCRSATHPAQQWPRMSRAGVDPWLRRSHPCRRERCRGSRRRPSRSNKHAPHARVCQAGCRATNHSHPTTHPNQAICLPVPVKQMRDAARGFVAELHAPIQPVD